MTLMETIEETNVFRFLLKAEPAAGIRDRAATPRLGGAAELAGESFNSRRRAPS
jgi:hypothetical protein